MDSLAANPAFRTYAVCSAILVLKMIISAAYTGSRRQAHQSYINPEDAQVFGKGVQAGEVEGPEVARALRIERHDLANIPLFFVMGLIYVLSGGSSFGAAVYCWSFTISRIAHTYCYMNGLQPWRAIAFGIGALSTILMTLQVLLGWV